MATQLNTLLESPGSVINETDISQTTTNAVGTNIFIPGFTPQGPSDEPTQVSSLTEFESIFGLPVTAAEKYTHNALEQILNSSNANVTFTRMPYGSGAGYGFAETYNALVFPMVGLSAIERTPCEYFRKVDESTCQVSFPWLYQHFTPQSMCYGSSNLECPLNSKDETPGSLYLHNHPFKYNTVMTGFKFVVNSHVSPDQLKIFQFRPIATGNTTSYYVVTSLDLSSIYVALDRDQTHLSDDGHRLLVDVAGSVYASAYKFTSGPLSGQTVSGISVSANDIFGTYSYTGAPVLKYFDASPEIAGSFRTGVTVVSSLSAGSTVTVVSSALNATTQDMLISFCGVPVDAGLSCATITALNLQIPEEDKYIFVPLLGDALLNDANFYALGEPISQTLNMGEYQLLQNGQFNWKCGVYENGTAALDVVNNNVQAGIIVVNKIKSAQLDDYSGYYLAMNDNLNVNPSTNFDDITAVSSHYNNVCPGVSGSWVQIPSERLNFAVSADFNGTAGSITEIVQQNAGTTFGDKKYNDSLIFSYFKLSPSRLTDTISQLNQVRLEQFIGSLDASRKVHDDFGGADRTFYAQDVVNNGSNYMQVLVNPYVSQNNCWTDQSTGLPQKTVRMFREKTAGIFGNFSPSQSLQKFADNIYGTGTYTGNCTDAVYNTCVAKDIGNLPAKLERALNSVENPIDYPIDITIDNGLSTIWATRNAVAADHCITDPTICYNYDDTYYVNTDSLSPFDGTIMSSSLQQNWEVIFNIFNTFAQYTRKAAGGVPHVHLQDPLRQIFVNGKDYKVVQRQKSLFIDPTTNQPSEKYSTFSRNIYSYLNNLYQGNSSSYSISYANWIKGYDSNSDSFCWYGPSAYEAALYARNDFNQYPWTSPLGFDNGKLANVVDLAINPNQRERDLLSRISVNPIVRFPEGYLNWNSLTLLNESSALKEISIRRGAVWLAKSIQSNLNQFIGKPNNITTRTRVNNTLKPILDYMKDNGGLYDYLIVCDERNNTSASIDQGVMNVAVYIKPTRPVKFILVDLIITGSGVNFSELI
jgi:hypothetical protein